MRQQKINAPYEPGSVDTQGFFEVPSRFELENKGFADLKFERSADFFYALHGTNGVFHA